MLRSARTLSVLVCAVLSAGCDEDSGAVSQGAPTSPKPPPLAATTARPVEVSHDQVSAVSPDRAAGPARKEPPAAAGVDVVFDQSLDQVSSPLDSGFEGLSRLSVLLRSHGASVSINNHPLHGVLKAWTGKGRVLVLGIPWGKRYSAADREAVDVFLRGGGGVLVIVEHDNIYGNCDTQNALTEPYGMRALGLQALGRAREGRQPAHFWPMVRVPAWNIEGARFYLPAPLQVAPPAKALAFVAEPADEARTVVVAAIAEVGAGRLAVVADLEFLWNMTPDSGVRAHRNRELVLRLIGELAGQGRALGGNAPAPAVPPAPQTALTACFATEGTAFYPQKDVPNGFTGLAGFLKERGFRIEVAEPRPAGGCDLAVVLAPLSPPGPLRWVLRSRRVLVAADGETDIVRAQPKPWGSLPGLDYREDRRRSRPLDALASALGLRFERATLLDAEGGLGATAQLASGARLHMHRAGHLVPSGVAFETVARAASGTTATNDLVPLAHAVGDRPELPGRPSLQPPFGAARGFVVAAKNRRVFALSDVDMLADQEIESEAGRELLAEIGRWLVE